MTIDTVEQPTREDMVEALEHLCRTAKALRRQGYTGIYGQSYARIHGSIDTLLTQLHAHA